MSLSTNPMDMALFNELCNPAVYVSFFMNPLSSEYETILDGYRLPLENLSLQEQRAQIYDWVERSLTRTDLYLDEKFWSVITTMAKLRHFRWDKHMDVLMLVQCFLPPAYTMIDCKRESYSLLLLMMELRSEYEKFPKKRVYIKEIAKKCAKMFVYQMNERKESDYYCKTVLHGALGVTSVMVGSWLFSVSPLTICFMIWLGNVIFGRK